MSESKRKIDARDKPKKKRFRSDGTPIWGQRLMNGPGIWVTCVKGKEKQTVGELYDLFESVANELWPETAPSATSAKTENGDSDSDVDEGSDIEKQIAKEVATIKRPRREQRFANCQTNTPCVLFISCKEPVDPVRLVMKLVNDVMETGVSQTRTAQRLTPVSACCPPNLPEIQSLCTRLLAPILEEYKDKAFTYKIELRLRNHTNLKRPDIVQTLAKCVPDNHKVDLDNPEVFILVEIFKSVCGISIVKDYYRLQKFNLMEIANSRKGELEAQQAEEGRVGEKKAEEHKED
ncbi:hypothetical protein K474DRAFT_1659968 [Panus rudis PR-1116 ss-1]|nr:hypothetical protein K474DRAFT_1659968 [Panus rudis PR-1116 ss-1]